MEILQGHWGELLLLSLFLSFILGIIVLLVFSKMPKNKMRARVGSFTDTGFVLLEISAELIEDKKKEIADELNESRLKIQYLDIPIPQGVIILGSFRDNNTVTMRLRAIINRPFEKTTQVILKVYHPNGQVRIGTKYSTDDIILVGLSDEADNLQIIFGPALISSLLSK